MNASYKSAGAWLGYRDIGVGLPVVFLHPTPLDSEFWTPVVERLQGIRAIVPDLRGHGLSELGQDLPVGGFSLAPEAPVLSMERLAEDVLTLLDRLGLPKAVFVGSSIGGYVMLEIWRRAPRRVHGMAFICSKPQPDAVANLPRRAAMIRQALSVGTAELFDGMANLLVGATARAQQPEIVAALRARMTLSAVAVAAVQAGLALRSDSTSDIVAISVPILAIHGAEDSGVSADEMDLFRSASGGCELHSLTGAGHFAAYEQPMAVAAWLDAWIRRLPQ